MGRHSRTVRGAFQNQPECLGAGNVLHPENVCRTPEEWSRKLDEVVDRGWALMEETFKETGKLTSAGSVRFIRRGGFVYAYLIRDGGDWTLELVAPEGFCGDLSPWAVRDMVR